MAATNTKKMPNAQIRLIYFNKVCAVGFSLSQFEAQPGAASRCYRVTRSRRVAVPRWRSQAGGVFCDMFTGGWRCHHTCHQRALAGQRHTEQRARSKMNRHEYRPALFQLFGDVFVVGTALLVEAVI